MQFEHVGKNLGEVVQNVFEFGFHMRFFKINIVDKPQPGENFFYFGPDLRPFQNGVHRIFEHNQLQVKFAVIFQHDRSFGFGRMGGEHRFNLNL